MKPRQIALLIITAIACIILFSVIGCTSTKDLRKTRTVIDNRQIQDMIDSIELYKSETFRLEHLLRQSEYSSVVFDSTKCPQIVFPGCPGMANNDTVQKLILDLNGYINRWNMLENKIKILSDGSIEASGKIKELRHIKENQSSLIINQQKIIDSLSLVKQKVETVIKTEVVEKELHKKTTVLNFWWLLIIGAILRDIVNRKSFIYSIIKKLRL